MFQLFVSIHWKTMGFYHNTGHHWQTLTPFKNIFSAPQKKQYHTGLEFGTTWGWVNDDRIEIFSWTIPFILSCFLFPWCSAELLSKHFLCRVFSEIDFDALLWRDHGNVESAESSPTSAEFPWVTFWPRAHWTLQTVRMSMSHPCKHWNHSHFLRVMKPGFDSEALDRLPHNSHRLKEQSITKYKNNQLFLSVWRKYEDRKISVMTVPVQQRGDFIWCKKTLPSSRTNNDYK